MPRHLRPVPPTGDMSIKRAAFKRVVEPRIANAVNDLELLAICADRNRYEIYDSDMEYICDQVRRAAEDCIARFQAGTRKPFISLPE
jgi:hypothetical protein